MLANETPVCVTIRDCCTAGFDVHLPYLLSFLPSSSFCLPAFYFLPTISTLKEGGRLDGDGRASIVEMQKCKNEGRNRRSEEKEARNVPENRAALVRIGR